jgi:hypothetical protein
MPHEKDLAVCCRPFSVNGSDGVLKLLKTAFRLPARLSAPFFELGISNIISKHGRITKNVTVQF